MLEYCLNRFGLGEYKQETGKSGLRKDYVLTHASLPPIVYSLFSLQHPSNYNDLKWREETKSKKQGGKITPNAESYGVCAATPQPRLQRSDSTAAGNDGRARDQGKFRL